MKIKTIRPFNHSTVQRVKAYAFTLAETLIVIGVIGVVAALTLPNLNSSTGDKEKITRVKKIYSSLTEAFDRAQAVYGDYSTTTWLLKDGHTLEAQWSETLAKRITEFMKISKDCGVETGCFKPGSNIDRENESYYKVVTADGMSIAFYNEGSGDHINTIIYVDIDGPNKGKGAMGSDLFRFEIDEARGYLFAPNSEYPGVTGINNLTNCLFVSYNCASGWIIQNDNIDYLKADSTGKCNDSDIVLNWTTNTSCH